MTAVTIGACLSMLELAWKKADESQNPDSLSNMYGGSIPARSWTRVPRSVEQESTAE
jgi:hypothetical protein